MIPHPRHDAEYERRFADGHAERQQMQSEADNRRVIREGFELSLSDEEIRAAVEVVDKRGTRGAPTHFSRDGLTMIREALQACKNSEDEPPGAH